MREFKKNDFTICDLCRRNGGFSEDDVYVCKYNKNNIEIGWNDNPKDKRFKCKYFKRHYKYILSNFMSKRCEHHSEIGKFRITYKQGKFATIKIGEGWK